jgi:hypothetical protein
MPSERRGTVTDDLVGYIRRLQGSTEWKGDQAGTVRAAIAKVCTVVFLQDKMDGTVVVIGFMAHRRHHKERALFFRGGQESHR